MFLLYTLLFLIGWTVIGAIALCGFTAYKEHAKAGASKFQLWLVLWIALPIFMWLLAAESSDEDPSLLEFARFLFLYQDTPDGDFSP